MRDKADPLLSRQGGFTLIEVTIALVILAVLAAVAVPFLQDTSYKAQVNGTAESLSSAVNLHSALSVRADTEESGYHAYEFREGKVCVQDGPGSSPVEPIEFDGDGRRNSEKLWNVFLGERPIRDDPTELTGEGWIATTAGDCEKDSSFTYCWDYYTSSNNRVATIRYNNNDQAGIEVIWDDG